MTFSVCSLDMGMSNHLIIGSKELMMTRKLDTKCLFFLSLSCLTFDVLLGFKLCVCENKMLDLLIDKWKVILAAHFTFWFQLTRTKSGKQDHKFGYIGRKRSGENNGLNIAKQSNHCHERNNHYEMILSCETPVIWVSSLQSNGLRRITTKQEGHDQWLLVLHMTWAHCRQV